MIGGMSLVKVRLASHQIRRAQRYVENSTPPLRQHSRGHLYSPAHYLQHHATSQWSIGRRLGKKPACMSTLFVVASNQNDPIERPIQSKANSRHAYRRVSICLIHTRHVQIRLLSSHSSYSRSACSPQTQAPSWVHRCVPPALPSYSHSRPHSHAHSYLLPCHMHPSRIPYARSSLRSAGLFLSRCKV